MISTTDRVDEVFAQWDKTDSPGCSLAVIKDGEIIYQRGYGMANLEHNVINKPETVYDIGSTSKQFTALCILLLARHGLLSLDDPIQKYLPEMPEYENPVTIRHLVHHTSGIRDYLTLMALANMSFENDYQEPVVVELIARQKALNFKPGDEFLYSNSGYFLMSEIVQRVSGKNLRDFAKENIFQPLGMNNTHFHNNFKEIVSNRVSGYSPKEDGSFEIDMGIFDVLGDGAVYTTVQDLFLWDQNFYQNVLDGGGQELLEQMQSCGTLNSGEKLDYAFGLMVSDYRGLKSVRHGGGWYGYRAQLLRFPVQRFSVICLANLGTFNPEESCRKVADIYLAESFSTEEAVSAQQKEEAFIEVSEEKLETFVGYYRSQESGTMCEIVMGESNLTLEALGLKINIAPVSERKFKSVKSPYNILLDFDEAIQNFHFDAMAGMMKDTFQRIKPATYSPEELAEFTGDYFSAELGITYHISIQDNLLQFSPANPLIKPLKPAIKDLFSAGMVTVKFERDAENRIQGYRVNAGRVKDIFFTRQ